VAYRYAIGAETYRFEDLRTLLAKASPSRSGDLLAGVAADSEAERIAAKLILADLPLQAFFERSRH